MSDAVETFFTSIGCMDGRVQEPIMTYGRKKFHALYPDTLTEAGLVGKYTQAGNDSDLGKSIKFKAVEVSIGKHASKGIVVHGHQECAGNLIDDESHVNQVSECARLLEELNPGIPVIPVFLYHENGQWVVKEL